MPQRPVRILNFDNSVSRQEGLLQIYNPLLLDLTCFAQAARHFMSAKTRRKIEECLGKAGYEGVSFIGSGDFHHVSEILTSWIKTPFSLLVFDFHPDWDILPPVFACGSWVRRALKNKNIIKCVLMGTGSEDLSGAGLLSADLASLSGGRLEIYPYRHSPSRAYFRGVADNPSVELKRGLFSTLINWRQLENEDLAEFAGSLAKRLASKNVYISIDKDCLRREFAVTNWEEGLLGLEQLLLMLKIFRDNLNIIGVDITGDYSSVFLTAKFKSWISRLDHPRKDRQDTDREQAAAVNETTNLRILETICG